MKSKLMEILLFQMIITSLNFSFLRYMEIEISEKNPSPPPLSIKYLWKLAVRKKEWLTSNR